MQAWRLWFSSATGAEGGLVDLDAAAIVALVELTRVHLVAHLRHDVHIVEEGGPLLCRGVETLIMQACLCLQRRLYW
jgi:hypothetical protein